MDIGEITGNTFSGIINRIENLFERLGIPRVYTVVVLGIIVMAILFFIEGQMGIVFFRNMEKKVSLLKELHSLAQEGINQSDELNPIYQETLAELAAYKVHFFSFSRITNPEGFWKFLAGGSVGFLLVASGLLKKVDKWEAVVIGGLVIAATLGTVGVLIPNLWSPWVNCVAYLGLEFIILLAFGRRSKKTKKT